jgi:hypothetical protein
MIRETKAITSLLLGLLLAAGLVLLPTGAAADDGGLTEAEVRAAVETWVRYVTADARPDAVVERMEPYQVDAETVAYIAHLEGGGFCLCGADELVLPVYFYSPHGTYDPQNPNYQYILWEISTRLKSLRRGLEEGEARLQAYQEALSERATFWQDLIAGRAPTRTAQPQGTLTEPISMTVDLTSRWHQGSPYNDQCPVLTPPDEHTVVGCVATAMSQIMYYWKWPNTGQGDGDVDYEYRWRDTWDEEPLAANPRPDWGTSWRWGNDRLWWTSANGGRLRMNGYWDESLYEAAQGIPDAQTYPAMDNYLDALEDLWDGLPHDESENYSANFGATTYNWSVMADVHNGTSDAADAEVAKLCHHAGVAVEMDYGVRGSGAFLYNSEAAFEDHFRYDPDAIKEERDIHAMTAEIQWLRPIVFAGASPDGGGRHAWVVLGYNKGTDPDRQFLMNLGWGGDNDWYSCDEIQYSEDQWDIIHIAPIDVVKFVGSDNPGDGSPDDPYRGIQEAVIEAPDYATLIFRAASINTFSSDLLVIDRPFTLKGQDVIIRQERHNETTTFRSHTPCAYRQMDPALGASGTLARGTHPGGEWEYIRHFPLDGGRWRRYLSREQLHPGRHHRPARRGACPQQRRLFAGRRLLVWSGARNASPVPAAGGEE